MGGPRRFDEMKLLVMGLGGTFYALSVPYNVAPKLHALDGAGQPLWAVTLPAGISSDFSPGPEGLLVGADSHGLRGEPGRQALRHPA